MGILPSHAAWLSHSFVALVFPCNTTAVKATIGIITRGRYSTRPEQQQQQEEEEENEFDGIQLLWIEPEASEQLKF